jgi:hypothetical protein
VAQVRRADGRIVDLLREVPGKASTHEWLWDTAGREDQVPAGVYFISVRTEVGSRTARAVVIR